MVSAHSSELGAVGARRYYRFVRAAAVSLQHTAQAPCPPQQSSTSPSAPQAPSSLVATA